jgi:uncharacterized Ntn-hydrolase superfamily protein
MISMKKLATLLLLITSGTSMAQVYKNTDPLAHTFSIVARDAKTGEMAAAVQSHWFSVGTSVIWGKSGVGVVCTQSFVNKSYGPLGLGLMEQGKAPQVALDELLKKDAGREVRQVAFLNTKGASAVYTGKSCIEYAYDMHGVNYSVQSNMMLTDKVCKAMQTAFLAHANAFGRTGCCLFKSSARCGRGYPGQAVGGIDRGIRHTCKRKLE